MAIKSAVKTHILYYFLIEAEPLDFHYQAEPGNEKVSIRRVGKRSASLMHHLS
jgi:hypothetical protein